MHDPNEQHDGAEQIQVNDRRRFTEEGALKHDEVAAESTGTLETIASEELRLWQERAEAAESKLREFTEGFRRYKDEHDAIRMRLERDRETRVREALARAFTRVLDAVDTLEMALAYAEGNPLAEGLKLSLKGIHEALASEGLERMSLIGETFDPACAEAVAAVPVEDPELHNRVLAETRPGYALGGVVIRPAQVRVGQRRAE
jgi:molecular chaperone GrpE